MKVMYNKKYEKNAPVDEPPEQDKNKKEIQEHDNISLKEFLVIFIISLLIFPVCILIQNIIKII